MQKSKVTSIRERKGLTWQLIERMGRVNAEPILRRLLDIAEIWRG